jgi:hypothetical protein
MNLTNMIARMLRRQRALDRRKIAKREVLARYGRGAATVIVEGITHHDGTVRTIKRRVGK